MAKKETVSEEQTTSQPQAGAGAGAAKLKYDLSGTVVRIVLHNGDAKGSFAQEQIIDEASFDAAGFAEQFVSGESVKTLIGYGLLKLLQDRTSQVSTSVADKFNAMILEADRLLTPDENGAFQWKNAVVRASGSTGPRARTVDSFLAQAVAELKGIPVAQASGALAGLDKESLDKIRANEKVKEIVARLKAESAPTESAALDLSSLL